MNNSKNRPPAKTTTLQKAISHQDDETVVFVGDILSEPRWKIFLEKDPLVHSKCARSLPIANEGDIVVLAGKLDHEYYDWIRSLGLGPAHVVEYGQEKLAQPLCELVLMNPEPVSKVLKQIGNEKSVYVPFYASSTDQRCAQAIGADFFGSEEKTTLKYFDKVSFKQECQALDIETVEGFAHDIKNASSLNYQELAQLVSGLLSDYDSVIIRGSDGSAGHSLFKTDSPNIRDLYQKMLHNKEKKLLVEPFLNVIASPNDQWVINREGDIEHLGVSAQLFHGLKHAGNIKGQYFSGRSYRYIVKTSYKIVQRMAAVGYRGVLGIDYIVCDEGIFPIENNARLNGSSYSLGIVSKLEESVGRVRYWKFFKAQTSPCSFRELCKRLDPLLYDQQRANSIFPYDCDQLPHNGTFAALLLAEDMYHLDNLEQSLQCLDIERI